MNWFKNNFPNFLTCCNLACGVFAIFLLSIHGLESIELVEYLLIIAGIADFFDGFAARALKSSSNIGKDLDSLADNVTFGVLPSLVFFLIIRKLSLEQSLNENLALFSLPIALFSSVRLAIFNNDTRQSDQFIGVPTPANAFFLIFLTGSFLRLEFNEIYNIYNLIIVSIFSSLWLVAPVPLIALKFKNFQIKDNWLRFVLLGLSLIFILFLGKSSVPLIFLTYLAVSIINYTLVKNEF
jgi:CDP-diacylglycerol--serine O-phosphatidyltransferase